RIARRAGRLEVPAPRRPRRRHVRRLRLRRGRGADQGHHPPGRRQGRLHLRQPDLLHDRGALRRPGRLHQRLRQQPADPGRTARQAAARLPLRRLRQPVLPGRRRGLQQRVAGAERRHGQAVRRRLRRRLGGRPGRPRERGADPDRREPGRLRDRRGQGGPAPEPGQDGRRRPDRQRAGPPRLPRRRPARRPRQAPHRDRLLRGLRGRPGPGLHEDRHQRLPAGSLRDFMIVVEGLRKRFIGRDRRPIPVLDGIDLSARTGEFVSVIGPSGSGKSTLLNILAGLDTADAGRVELDGRLLEPGRHAVAYMPQRDTLLPWRSVLDNVALPLQIQGVGRAAARERARELLPAFGLDGFERAHPFTLSGGMRQRAALARTIIQDRSTLLLDEPFGALDSLTRSEMQEFLLSVWARYERTVLFVTHDIREATYLSDRVLVLSGRPARVVRTLDIDLPRPRTIELTTTPEFARLEALLLQALRDSSTLDPPTPRRSGSP